ncbi:hypothetical protein BKA66DRAFT_258320 [Pyrenochaeta sp. MPI-SDFR-AT-0127]|nr:hypothetical protein BKA66DRAFT_258320 [Pyrenochaeta sp. MPI-SDFR-AT-0127]
MSFAASCLIDTALQHTRSLRKPFEYFNKYTSTDMIREITVSSNTPMPKGYGFLPKGIRYKTLHGRKLTHEAGKLVYVVVDQKKQVATEKRDSADIAKAATEIVNQFPKIPSKQKDLVLKHGFKKFSGRVGRTKSVPMPRKVLLAVIAHVRHKHTEYDALLSDGKDRDEARRLTKKKIENVMREWGFTGDLSWYFHCAERASSEDSNVM